MQTICFDYYELHSKSAFNYVTNKMIEMVNKENKTVKDLSGYHWIIGDKVAGHIFPERPTKIFDYDVVYEDPSIFYQYGINFEESKLRTTGCALDRLIKDVLNGIYSGIDASKLYPKQISQLPFTDYSKMYIKKEDKNMNIKLYMDKGFIGGVVTKPHDLIKNVIFSGPCTIVQWLDGDKTIVRCENEDFDKEKGLAMAIVKKFFGTNESKSNYNDIFKKWIPDDKKEESSEISIGPVVSDNKDIHAALSENIEANPNLVYLTLKQYANMTGMSKSTIIRQINSGKIFGAKKDETGKWVIPVGEV